MQYVVDVILVAYVRDAKGTTGEKNTEKHNATYGAHRYTISTEIIFLLW